MPNATMVGKMIDSKNSTTKSMLIPVLPRSVMEGIRKMLLDISRVSDQISARYLHARRHKHEEDPARLHELHDGRANKTTKGECALGACQKSCSVRRACSLWHTIHIAAYARLNNIVDECSCDTDLGAGVAKLSKGSVEETVLLAEGLDVGASIRNICLERHVGVCDLRDLVGY